jgi:YHS domain-containing protein
MKVDSSKLMDSLHSANFNGQKYFFCSPFCKAAFIDDPELYVGKEKNINAGKNDNKK